MFDKILFDRNAFDRSVSSDSIDVTIVGSGRLDVKLVMRTDVPMLPFRGAGDMLTTLVAQQRLGIQMAATGGIAETEIILRLPLTAKFSGAGVMVPNMALRTPTPVKFSGAGAFAISNQMVLYQYMIGALSGSGSFIPKLVARTEIPTMFNGSGEMNATPILRLPLSIPLKGSGEMILRRIGARNENVIELIDINLLPGETIIIDTDLLQVWFGIREDVSAITPESVFFELFPGDNELTVDTDTEEKLDITTIWQNRWL